MKIVVISDTHLPQYRARLGAALRHVSHEHPDVILHCGDLTTLEVIAAFESIAPVDAVAGNNDGQDIVNRFGRRKVVAFDGVHIGMVHGDGTRGTTLERARAAFRNERVDGVLFGHSHVPYLEDHDGVWVFNPGSIMDKRRQPRYSYGVVDADAAGIYRPRLVYFDGDERP